MLPRSVYGINWKNLHAQPSLDAKNYNMQALAITDLKSWMVQFICHHFEVQARVLQPDKQGLWALHITMFSTVLKEPFFINIVPSLTSTQLLVESKGFVLKKYVFRQLWEFDACC